MIFGPAQKSTVAWTSIVRAYEKSVFAQQLWHKAQMLYIRIYVLFFRTRIDHDIIKIDDNKFMQVI